MTKACRPPPPSHGDFVSLREFLECRIIAIEKGIEVANNSMQARLSGMNEFREALRDQAARHVTRDELDIKLENLAEQLRALQVFRAVLEGKASQTQANIILVIAIIGLIISIVSLVK